ncbi:MAG: ROK family transcriptional regulator [Ruminococcaceae bacterium]|nr:ROK family transcriptional regulator [Oscillospiraceae bacterium]
MEQKGSNQRLVKVTNQHLIIKEVRARRQMSRSDLAKVLKLSNPSVSKHVDDLIAKGLLVETGSMVTDVGRRPIMLQFNGRHGCVAVVDLSSNDARLCVADLLGNKLEYSRVEGGQMITVESIDRIIVTLRDMLSNLGNRCGPLIGVCIGAPGIVEPETGRIQWSARIEDYENLDLRGRFEKAFDAQVIIKNDINLAVVGERIFGAGGGLESMLLLSIDAGVGLSAIIGGKLYEGIRGLACDLGVLLNDSEEILDLDMDGRSYMPHLIERRVNIYSLTDSVRAMLDEGRESVLREWVTENDDLTFDDIARAYGMNDPMTVRVVRRYAKRVAILCKNLSSLFDVELILLGGMIAKLGSSFLSELLGFYSILPGYGSSELKLSKLFDSAVIFGGIDTATQYAIDRIIGQEGAE